MLLKAPANEVVANTISGSNRGIVFSGPTATGNLVSGNFIGVDSTGTVPLGMTTGIQISQSANSNTIGPDNLIANNGTGIRMIGSAGVSNQITQNSFVNNAVVGIDFGNPGPTNNDADDVDEGANRKQNHPELVLADIIGDDLDVTFSVPTAVANATYDFNIEIFKSDSSGQGNQYLGTFVYATADANTTITRSLSSIVTAFGLQSSDFISATATDAAGNTSEFSAPVSIPVPGFAPPAGGSASRSAFDVSADGTITALDALLVINDLADQGEGESDAFDLRGDVNADGQVTALDALRIINWLSTQTQDESG